MSFDVSAGAVWLSFGRASPSRGTPHSGTGWPGNNVCHSHRVSASTLQGRLMPPDMAYVRLRRQRAW